MSKTIKPYQDSDTSKKEQVAQMFDTISGNYDGLNKIISLGTDAAWKKKILKMVQLQNPTNILDIATGTGDLAILFAATSAKEIIGLDISHGMLEVGKKKILDKKLESKIQMVLGDGEQIPYADNYFDVITIAYGVRNFENLDKGLSEVLRVLKPNGLLLILETSVPTKFPVKQGYYVYTNFIMPAIGKLFSKDKKAYAYLSNSAQNFPFGEALNNILRKIGFIDVKHLPQTLGVATIYKASKK
ncbi:bifunctional demethylmenaquinone methyltransferase/2-methoxy-6-polyprenyl-1,4-benzoquinol methylase UbiE [Flavobacterium difficile]|uniref:Demethylmenaquinone methyltransferase n=1 Tax=Flavobacterium difficile TaxID=2709659 RepID=A0ABX0I0I8_9FLAO|nr:bifunctional demethylmenaquinone methyltransferase/2-methoxy-6-polyprenyl-1,4-benzoquinol methylase UbiE [Flavobacterium difficile]NHM00705.1 bifunctional demethylmenaquinone methyltransferase/2-methoxy-6-polyprenyl-1,4-benzoquinol methylase UbiE [Flavobacterium difficile]